LAWKANRRNYRLLQFICANLHNWRDWAFLLAIAVVLLWVFVLPLILSVWLVRWLAPRV
jgi:hypothetical protein